jgi:NAD(P) transhydrogenase subunit alpha
VVVAGVPKESFKGEKRVALVPAHIPLLIKNGMTILVERGAGIKAGFPDELFKEKGAEITSRDDVFNRSDIILFVRGAGSNPIEAENDLNKMKDQSFFIGQLNPYDMDFLQPIIQEKKLTAFALELMPRISRAQSMDILSSMASIAGYKAAVMAADSLHKIFPMMMTAAGTVTPAKILVIGAGVAGLQAIATTHRLGALVTSYDIRPVVKEQVESLGAKFLELDLKSEESEDKGGYAKEMDEEFYERQRVLLGKAVSQSDVVITTASIPGKKAPVLITSEMVHAMSPGSLIIDLAAERGGNCELTEPGQIIEKNGVKIIGPENLPSEVPNHASQLFSKNISNFLSLLIKDNNITYDEEDEIIKGTLICRSGETLFGQST